MQEILFIFYFIKFTLYHAQFQIKFSVINKIITLCYIPGFDLRPFLDKSWKSTVRTCVVETE
jgi:hypothetical protein